ncbi:3-deoxy-D-manno-octulosonic acid transferase [Devosia sp.]|uniref:3-deoxy-D-manno-octulosonic acid transferase n=1 Tax=Devosia sp. TaxID=1871048 RepID=UPI003A8F9E2E
MAARRTIGGRIYDGLVVGLSWLHYAVLSPLGKSDEGGAAWFRRRLKPALPAPVRAPRVWIHAVSAGESKVAGLLRAQLLREDPSLCVVLSATTYSGFERIQALAGPADSFIMPLDTEPAQTRLFAKVRPDLLVLVESEFWPAQFAAAEAAGVPVVVANATMSERSFARHQKNGAVAKRTVLKAERIFAQDEIIAARYRALGVPEERIAVTGNLKLVPPEGASASPRSGAPVVVFGNVHQAELAALAPAVAALRRSRRDLRIVLVPRYPGKLTETALQQHFGSGLALVTELSAIEDGGPLLWLDRMGTLATAYAQATVGVVCGTFAPIGGHDLAEPLHLGAASLYGPHVERQKALHAALSAAGCAVQVDDATTLATEVLNLLDDPARRATMLAGFADLSHEAEIGLAIITGALRNLLSER